VLLETETDTERREKVLAARFRDTEREFAGVGLTKLIVDVYLLVASYCMPVCVKEKKKNRTVHYCLLAKTEPKTGLLRVGPKATRAPFLHGAPSGQTRSGSIAHSTLKESSCSSSFSFFLLTLFSSSVLYPAFRNAYVSICCFLIWFGRDRNKFFPS
jgi:hypothetical protein